MSRWKLGSMVSKWVITPIYPIYNVDSRSPSLHLFWKLGPVSGGAKKKLDATVAKLMRKGLNS